MIEPVDIAAAAYIIDESRVVEILGDAMRTDRRGRKDDPSKLRLLLIGLFLCIHLHGRAVVTDAHELLTRELPMDEQFALGVRRWTRAKDGTSRLWVLPIFDLYELTSKVTNKLGYGHGKHPDLEEPERVRRRAAITTYCDELMDVFDLGWVSQSFAMDATGIWSWGKGKGTSKDTDAKGGGPVVGEEPSEDELVVGDPTSHDRDAAWGVKTSKSGTEERYYGYEEHTLLQVPDDGQEPDDEPRLIRRFAVTAASTDVVEPSLGLIDRFNARACRLAQALVRILIADRHYHYKAVHRWKDELTARGIEPVLDLRADEHGFTEDVTRVRWGAGDGHCPGTPDALGTIPRPGPGEPDSRVKAFRRKIATRQAYALRRTTALGPDGTHRAQCPALAGTCGCPLRAGTEQAAIELGLPLVMNPPDPERDGEPLPACCTQQTVTLTPPDQVRKLQQAHYWGGAAWWKRWKKRPYVEGSYGNRKNTNTENMRRGQFRFTGIAWVNIVVGLSAASYNLRMLRNWQARTDTLDPTHPLVATPPERFGSVLLSEEEYRALAERFRSGAT